MMSLGAVTDDHTGAIDLANTLVQNGMRVAQMIDVPDRKSVVPDVDAVVIALKSRTFSQRKLRRSSWQP